MFYKIDKIKTKEMKTETFKAVSSSFKSFCFIFTLLFFITFSLSIISASPFSYDYLTHEQTTTGSGGNPFDQWLNTTNNVEFVNVTATYYLGSGKYLTDISAGGGNPFNQILNTTSNVSFGDVYLNGSGIQGDGLTINENVGSQSVIWFRNNGIAKSSIFFNNATNEFAWGTYTNAGAWNGYGMRINQTNKHASFYGNITSPTGNFSINEIESKKITETITTNNYGLKINRNYAVSPVGTPSELVNITSILPAGSIGVTAYDNAIIETLYNGIANVGGSNLHSKLTLGTGGYTGANFLAETICGSNTASSVFALLNADSQTSTASGNAVAIDGSTKGNRSTALYGAYTKAQNVGSGTGTGYYGYGQTNSGNAVGVFGFCQSTSGFCSGISAQPFSTMNMNSYAYQGSGNNFYSSGVTYFYSSQALNTAQNVTNFKNTDTGSVWINKYLEVDNKSFFDDDVVIAKNLNVSGNITMLSNGIYKIGSQSGLTGNYTIMKTAVTTCNLNFTGGILVATDC